jgi:hypothetical protein
VFWGDFRAVCELLGSRTAAQKKKNHWHKRNLAMSEEQSDTQSFVRIPMFQRVLDNPFILLFVGVVVPAVFYIIWGIMEIVTIPIAP